MHRSRGRRLLAAGTVACAAALLAPGGAMAHGEAGLGAHHFEFNLAPVPHDPAADNGSNVTGAAEFVLRGRRLSADLTATGLDALPHAMHIHGKDAGELAFCPGADRRDDLVDDGLIETVEGLEDYGGVQISLTTSGDTSAGSGLALDRFAVADAFGVLTYERTFLLPRQIARDIAGKHVVIHGEDLNRDGMYGGRTTALGAPLEAELPVACGEIAR